MIETQRDKQARTFQYEEVEQDTLAEGDTIDDNKNFILLIAGITFNVYSLWRFPYLLCKYGSVFLIPYAIFYILVLFPFVILEVGLAQHHQLDFLSFWLKTCPLFKGLGYCSLSLSFSFTLFLSVSIVYLATTSLYYYNYRFALVECFLERDTKFLSEICNPYNNSKTLIRQFEFLNFDATRIAINSDDVTWDAGTTQMALCLTTFLSYILFSSIHKLKYLTEILWVLVIMPTIYFTGLMIFFLCQKGSQKGVIYCFRFDIANLYDLHIWVDGSLQIILTSGCGLGSIAFIASHQYFYANPIKNCKYICYFMLARTGATCLLCVFYLGYVMDRYSTKAEIFLYNGFGWIISISTVVKSMLTSPIMEINGFMYYCINILMLFFNVIINMRTFNWIIQKHFLRKIIDKDWKRIVCTVIALVIVFVASNIFRFKNTLYLFTLVHITCCYLLLWILFLKSIAFSWFYGVDEIENNFKEMIGRKPRFYFHFCWRYAIPVILLFTIFGYQYAYVGHEQIAWDSKFTLWTTVVPVRIIFFYFPVLIVIICAIKLIRATEGSRYMQIAFAISPVQDHNIINKEKTCKRLHSEHWLRV